MQCPKPDCMYLHELGDEAASFTKEEMQVHFFFFPLPTMRVSCDLKHLFDPCYVVSSGRKTSRV